MASDYICEFIPFNVDRTSSQNIIDLVVLKIVKIKIAIKCFKIPLNLKNISFNVPLNIVKSVIQQYYTGIRVVANIVILSYID